MPHIIIEFARETASDEQLPALLDAVHTAVATSGLFTESHIKIRMLPVTFYRTGGGDAPFVHGQLRIKQGRSESQKKALSEAVLAAICDNITATCVVTVEVVDMDVASYAKRP